MMDALAKVELLYATLPTLDCKGLCARSCGPVLAELVEGDACDARYERVWIGGREVAVFETDRKLRCHLLKAGRCTVYENRPTVCRLWGLVESMPCHMGCVPERWLTVREGHEFLESVRVASFVSD